MQDCKIMDLSYLAEHTYWAKEETWVKIIDEGGKLYAVRDAELQEYDDWVLADSPERAVSTRLCLASSYREHTDDPQEHIGEEIDVKVTDYSDPGAPVEQIVKVALT